ncbi:cAMP-specific 3',5'-cyclic phosphodiesterase 4B [Chytriomyces hyalinus]|nr:cAMP-specific 3',5'-cyclic phosphodiesterase 4B [Chytriomyces hyalinus]
MLAIRGLMADTMTPVDHLGVLELIMACLSSPNLLTPDLDVQVKEGNVAIDDEQEKWLFHEVATRNANRGAGAGLEQIAQFETFKFGDSEYQPSGDALSLVEVDVDTRRPSAAVSTFGTPTSVISIQNFDAIFHSTETRNLLVRVPEFNFPIFDFVKSTDNHSLLVLGHHLIEESGLLNNLGLDSFKFNNFLATIEGGYHADLAFHNSVHATDVLHCINYMVQLPTIRSIFTDLEMLSLYVAAIIHDFDHPGVSNSFLIATADRRALLYNDKAVLENHHCASAFEVLARKECSFLSTLDRADYKSVRENVVDMVLATDLAQHFTLLTNFKKKVLTGDTFDPLSTREDRTLLMQMLMKCSDVSNPTKAWPEYSVWIDRIHEEWYAQGDMEKSRGLPFSPFCNRDGPHATNPASSQTGFINFIVSPLFEAFSAWTPIDEIWQGLEHNKNRWAEASPEAAQQSPAKKLSIKPSPLTMPTSPKSSFKSPMRLKSVGPIFSPTSPSTPFHGNSAAVKMKISRSKSTTHAPVYLSAVASETSLSPLVPDGARMGRRGSDSRDASK